MTTPPVHVAALPLGDAGPKVVLGPGKLWWLAFVEGIVSEIHQSSAHVARSSRYFDVVEAVDWRPQRLVGTLLITAVGLPNTPH